MAESRMRKPTRKKKKRRVKVNRGPSIHDVLGTLSPGYRAARTGDRARVMQRGGAAVYKATRQAGSAAADHAVSVMKRIKRGAGVVKKAVKRGLRDPGSAAKKVGRRKYH